MRLHGVHLEKHYLISRLQFQRFQFINRTLTLSLIFPKNGGLGRLEFWYG